MPSLKAPSAKLLARRGAKMALNREALDQITRAAVDGAFELAKAIVFGANVPDAPPFGEGLIETGGVIAYVDRKKVAEASKSGATIKRPRAAKLGKGIVVIGGFGARHGHFAEFGTIHQPARPFLTPELMATLPDAGEFIKAACIKHKVISR